MWRKYMCGLCFVHLIWATCGQPPMWPPFVPGQGPGFPSSGSGEPSAADMIRDANLLEQQARAFDAARGISDPLGPVFQSPGPSGPQGHVGLRPLVHPENQGHLPGADVHVDLPGQHGNTAPHAVVHRDHGASPGFRSIGSHVAGTHIDLPGQHGNDAPIPVVHRDHGVRSGTVHSGVGTGTGIHVDLPGQHGNSAPVPVVHRDHGEPHGIVHGASQFGQGPNIHVDMPGQHGNQAPIPVVHREPLGGHGGHGRPVSGGGIHIDRPGEHGNNSPVPVVHVNGVDHAHGAADHGISGIPQEPITLHRNPFFSQPGGFSLGGTPAGFPPMGMPPGPMGPGMRPGFMGPPDMMGDPRMFGGPGMVPLMPGMGPEPFGPDRFDPMSRRRRMMRRMMRRQRMDALGREGAGSSPVESRLSSPRDLIGGLITGLIGSLLG